MMRKTALLIALLLLVVASYAATAQTVTFNIDKMHCAGCASKIKKALDAVPGVLEANVSFEAKTAVVRFDPEKTGPETLIKAIADAGYSASLAPDQQKEGSPAK